MKQMRKPRSYYKSIDANILLQMLNEGFSQYEISDQLGLCREYIRKLFRSHNIPIVNRRKKEALPKELLLKEHYDNQLTLKEIATKYNRTYRSIKHQFKKYQIEVRNNTVFKNNRKRQQFIENIKLDYGTLTKKELQQKYEIGQQYIDSFLEGERKFFTQSSQEKLLYDWLKSMSENVITNDRTVISPKEIDLFLPDKNLGIEIYGLYWHSTKNRQKTNRYELLDKINLCSDISLLQFYEDEIANKLDICKSIILNKLGKSEKIFARKTSIEIISSNEANRFFNETHLQGSCVSTFYVGLRHNNELVSVMSFSKHRFSNSAQWEITRFSNKLNTQVIGGASKLLSYFENRMKPKIIISYADRRISNGNLYKKLGFSLSHTTKPNYYYVIGKTRSNRMNWQKKKLSTKLEHYDPALTEEQNMQNYGFYRIYDSGQLVYRKAL